MNETHHKSREDRSQAGNRTFTRRRLWIGGLGLAAVALIGLLVGGLGSSSEQADYGGLYTVEEGPLTISVGSSGDIRSTGAEVIKNEVEGRTSILWIIDEGTQVEEGDLLMELDSSELEDRKLDQEITVETAEANLLTAEENVELAKQQGRSEVDAARVEFELAVLDLEKYAGMPIEEILGLEDEVQQASAGGSEQLIERISSIDWGNMGPNRLLSGEDALEEGEYAQLLQEAENAITLARSEFEQAVTQLEGSSNLWEKGYLTDPQLERDRLEWQRRRLDVQVAESEKRLLEKFTKKRKLSELLSSVDQKAFALQKARHEADANLRDAEAKLRAQRSNYDREEERLEKINRQIAACTVTAPKAGMVIYGTTGQRREEPLDEGIEVRERMDLFRIPNPGSMTADIKIHESMLEKVSEGLPVIVTTDSLPNREFHGTIDKIAVMPDQQSRWLNPDLKVYNTEVLIEGDVAGLRPGMSCNAEIIVEEFDSTIHVPMQAVVRVNRQPTVYLPGNGGEPEPREVELGLDNNRMVQIVDGLEAGEQVLLNPPLGSGARPDGSSPTDEEEEEESATDEPFDDEESPEGDGRGFTQGQDSQGAS